MLCLPYVTYGDDVNSSSAVPLCLLQCLSYYLLSTRGREIVSLCIRVQDESLVNIAAVIADTQVQQHSGRACGRCPY
jgi:hypothetical protein